MVVMLSGCVIWTMPMMQKGILVARYGFESSVERGGVEAPRCSFGVLKCSSEAQNGHAGTQVQPNSTNYVNDIGGASLGTVGSFWAQLVS